MTKTLLSSFAGTIGTSPTLATEIWAASVGGTEANMTYQAGIAGTTGQSVQVTIARDFVWTTPGSHWRLGMWINRVSGTQSAGLAAILLRSSTTNRGDVFLRNQNGGQLALRAGAGGTTYAGQSTTTIANGDVWWVELEYNATAVTLSLWKPGNTTGTPDETFSGTTAAAVDNVRLFNPTGVTGMTMKFGELWMSDGEQIRASAPPVGTLNYNMVGAPASDGFVVKARTTGAASCRVKASTTSDLLTAPIFSSPVTPDADGYVSMPITGLASSTRYYWGVEVDGVLNTTLNGSAWTTAPAGTPSSFTFTSTSCHDWIGSTVFANALTRFNAIGSRFHVMLGDLGYPWITASGTPIAPADVAQLRAARLIEFEAPNVMEFYRSRLLSYTYSDGDGAGANSDGTWPAFVSGDVQAAYRQQVPLPTMPLTETQGRSWVDGNWRFIQTDELTMASARGATDNSAKTKLGTAQKAWFKAELQAALAAGQSVIWFGDGPWIGAPSVGGTLQEWRAYNTERVEIGNDIASLRAQGLKILRDHGDTHALAADDGTNNPYGGFPFISAAPFGTTAQVWGSTTTNGRWPAVSGAGRQHGEFTLTDDGTTRTLVFSGRAWDSGTSAYIEPVTMTVDMTPITPVTRTAAGTLTLSGTASRTVTVARTASGALTLAGTAERTFTVTRTATGTLELTGTASTTGSTDRTADGLLTLSGTASVSVTITRTAEGTLALGGIGTVTFQIVRTAMGILNLTGVGTLPGRTIPDRLTLTEIAVSHTLTDITVSHTLEDA